MKVQEKMRKPVMEAKYLNVENTERYRSISWLFYLKCEKLKYGSFPYKMINAMSYKGDEYVY